MRRADRLFALVQLIRGRRLSTAAWLATRLEVSPRSVYRDVAQLQAQGLPIEGEAGVGYRWGQGYDLPPLMFSADQARALVAAVRIARQSLDPALAEAADQALSRVLSVLPAAQRSAADSLPVLAPVLGERDPAFEARLQLLREACQGRRKLQIDYRDAQGQGSLRTVRPLGCFYWGAVWTLAAWCEARADFRSFRIDRMASVQRLADSFVDEHDKSLAELLRRVGQPVP